MSQDGDEQSPDGPDEFDFYFRFTKPLVLYLPTSEDRAIAAAWVEKLEAEPETEEEKRLRLDYLKLLLFVLQRGRLSGIFRKQPPSGPLQPFPQGFNMSDMGHLMIDQDDIQGCGGGDARTVPYTIEISNDLREFVAAQEIPNFGVQMYYAWSSDDPIHKWSLFDEEKFPQYVLDKIKLLKEIKSDEKTAASKGCGAKKLCDIPLIEKYTKTKVKSPQEIEKAQGRSYQAYMGFVGRMGGGFKDMCDDDADKYRKGGRCQKKPQKKCGPGDMPMDDEYETFLSGLSGNQGGNQGRGCPYQGPAHSPDCDNQMKSYDNQQQGSRSCSPKSRTEMPGPSAWASPVPRGQNRKPPMNYNGGGGGGGCPDQAGMMDDMQMNACPQRRSLSPTNRNCPPRSEPSPSQNNCNMPNQSGRAASSSPCPRDEEPAGARPGLSSAYGRQGGGGQPQPTAGMKQWTTPVDASFAGLPNRCPPPPQNDMMQCGGFDQRSQGPPMNQRGQDDNWCPPDMNDMQDSRRREKKGKQQMGQDCRDDDRAEMPPCPRPFQNSSPSCPPRQASSGYNSCSPPQSPQMQCKNQQKKPEMDMCARQQQPQDMDYCPDDDSMYGSAMPSTPRGPPGGNFCGGNQSWRPQGPPQQAPMKAINFDYSSGFDDGCNNQQMNRSNDNDPCGQRNDPCARMKDPCSQPPRNMPSRPPPKMQSPCPPNSYPQNGNGARNMGGMDGMKPKQDAGRDKCERKPLNDACPRPCPPPCPPPPQQQSCNRTPPQQQQQPPPQSQFCSPATHQIRLMPPSNFSQQPPMRNVQTAGGMGGAPYGRNLNSSMSKQSQQAYCPPQQSRKSPPPMYETYNMSKNNGGMNMMGPCPQGPPSGNFRGNYNQGMSQGEDCPEVCPEEEDDECTSAPESMDDRAQGSSSADCFDPAEEEAECMDDMQSAQWGSPKARPQAQAQPPPRSYNSMVNQRTKAYLDMVPPDACRRKNKIVASTPKKGGYNDSVSFGDSMSTLKPVDQSYNNNYFTLPNESAASYMQIEDNYGGFPRGGPCGPPQQQNDQSYGGSEQGGRGACPRPKEKKRRGGPSICDDNAQFDQGCKQSCGGY